MKYLLYLALLVALIGAAYKLLDVVALQPREQLAQCRTDLGAETERAARLMADVNKQRADFESKMAQRNSLIDAGIKEGLSEHIERVRSGERRRSGAALDSLRNTIQALRTSGCPGGGPGDPSPAEGSTEAAKRDGLHGGIAESFVAGVIVPAEEQTNTLLLCQDYLNRLRLYYKKETR